MPRQNMYMGIYKHPTRGSHEVCNHSPGISFDTEMMLFWSSPDIFYLVNSHLRCTAILLWFLKEINRSTKPT